MGTGRPRFQGGSQVNWLDEGALYSSIGLFLREDLGRGDITTQSVLMRNARARGRFVAGEKMVVAGLEAAEEVFITLDPQQQIEAFAADGEEVEAGKVIARTSGFADVLLAGERTALNLVQHLSGIATITRKFVGAIEGTSAVDTKDLIDHARKLSSGITVELSGLITFENVRAYAEAGADLIRVDALTQSVRAMDISFQIQPG